MTARLPVGDACPTWFGWFRDWLRARSGISLRDEQHIMCDGRLRTVSRRLGYDTIDELLEELARGEAGVASAVLDAFTTNETYFFRDGHPFDVLESTLLPSLFDARRAERRLRIWSAACSTGQEPYSVGMLLRERFSSYLSTWSIEIVATDISTEAIRVARAGEYSRQHAFRGLPPRYHRYLRPKGTRYVVDPAVRSMIAFGYGNLAAGQHPAGPFDLVLLRNVLIYFDAEVRGRVLTGVRERMRSDGLLLLGGAEVADPEVRERFTMYREGRTHWHRRRP